MASNVKYRGWNVIKSMRGFLFEMNYQKKLTDQILINDGRYKETATVYIPIVICECNRDKVDKSIEISVTNVELDKLSKSAIQNAAYTEIQQIEWKQQTMHALEVKSEFIKLITSSSTTQRIKDVAVKLFQSASYQTI